MKLASLPDGTRDGRLVVVSRDLTSCADAEMVAPTLQHALDHWDDVAPELEAISRGLETGSVWTGRFRERAALSPLPRAFQWLDGSAYVNHVALVRQARGADVPESFWTDPLMYQGSSDAFLAPRQDICMSDADLGIDLEAEVAIITGDVPMGADQATAATAIRLVMMANDVSLRAITGPELAKGFGFVQSKPPGSFSPVAVTPESLGEAWSDGKLHGTVSIDLNEKPLGRVEASEDMTFDFPRLISHAARTRPLRAGTIIGAGTVSNRDVDGGPGKPVADGGRGYACLAEQRMVETIRNGQAVTQFLADGDLVRIDFQDKDGRSVFGAIEHRVVIG
ncbi:MAG: fumarylacetoacetate hydrolase family protein [Pseudomonadota bacterium]